MVSNIIPIFTRIVMNYSLDKITKELYFDNDTSIVHLTVKDLYLDMLYLV